MNLSAFTRTECCNLRKSDNCCWADGEPGADTYAVDPNPPPKPCTVLSKPAGECSEGERCAYFEACVLPIAEQAVPEY